MRTIERDTISLRHYLNKYAMQRASRSTSSVLPRPGNQQISKLKLEHLQEIGLRVRGATYKTKRPSGTCCWNGVNMKEPRSAVWNRLIGSTPMSLNPPANRYNIRITQENHFVFLKCPWIVIYQQLVASRLLRIYDAVRAKIFSSHARATQRGVACDLGTGKTTKCSAVGKCS